MASTTDEDGTKLVKDDNKEGLVGDSKEPERSRLSLNKRKREDSAIKAVRPENQPLIDALYSLSTAALQAQSTDYKLRYKSAALEKAASELAKLNDVITSGHPLAAKGPHKVPGVGRGTAYYVDEFLKTGDISDIHKYEEKGGVEDRKLHGKMRFPSEEGSPTVEINRAPVLTLWVTVVAEQQGFNSREAYTYGRWISGVFAQSKGRALGILEAKEEPSEQERVRAAKRRRNESLGVDHLQVFQHVRIPVLPQNGDRLAVVDGKTLNPAQVQSYVERAFGDNLPAVKGAMKYLADSMPPEELRQRAYSLYEQFRPEWKGWGQKSSLKLDTIRALAA